MIIYAIAVLTFIFITTGIYRICMFALKMPNMKAYRTASKVVRVKHSDSSFGILVENLSGLLVKKIHLSEARKRKLNTWIKYSDNESTSAEMYVSKKIVRTLLIASPILVLRFVFPIAAIINLILAVLYFFRADSVLEKRYSEQRQEIEYELPRFCSTLNQEVKSSHDVLGMLERYANTSDKALKKELEITIADMKSSNYESALVRFESRLSLSSLSDIVRGLIGVIRGDNLQSYFEMLSHDLDALELQRLEDRAAKQPEKIKKYQFIILATMILVYVAVIALFIIGLDKSALSSL